MRGQDPDRNYLRSDLEPAVGTCYKNTFGEWHCLIVGAGVFTQADQPPAAGGRQCRGGCGDMIRNKQGRALQNALATLKPRLALERRGATTVAMFALVGLIACSPSVPAGASASPATVTPADASAGLYPGPYECWHFSTAAMMENFTILDGSHYTDAAGNAGTYQFNAGTGDVSFAGGALDGQQASYSQAATPPTADNPPTVNLKVSGDHCQRRL